MQIGLGISPTQPMVPAALSGPADGLVWDTAADYLMVDGTDFLIWQ